MFARVSAVLTHTQISITSLHYNQALHYKKKRKNKEKMGKKSGNQKIKEYKDVWYEIEAIFKLQELQRNRDTVPLK